MKFRKLYMDDRHLFRIGYVLCGNKSSCYKAKNKLLIFCVSVMLFPIFFSCKKLIEVNAPVTSINTANVYSNDATAASVLTGLYSKISDLNFELTANFSLTNIGIYTALSADELRLFDNDNSQLSQYYKNDLTINNAYADFWSTIYSIIYVTNAAIEGIDKSTTLTPKVKSQLEGEALFLRALSYFYLTNLYGDVPLVTTTDWKVNSSIGKTSMNLIYEKIVEDLIKAESLLNPVYVKADASTPYPVNAAERVRPTKWAAAALLSRAYLFMGKSADAEKHASMVIDSTTMFSLTQNENVFLKNSREAIWQIQPVRNGIASNTGEGALFNLPATGPNTSDYPVYLARHVADMFEPGDLRKAKWIDSVTVDNEVFYFPHKYKIGREEAATQEYIMVLRLAEQYLIRAEARANQNKLEQAQDDLNQIRNRAGLPGLVIADKAGLLKAVMLERQRELFTEWGHRWFDLKRTNSIDAVMVVAAVQKNGTWKPFQALYPVPKSEIQANSMLTQNPGY